MQVILHHFIRVLSDRRKVLFHLFGTLSTVFFFLSLGGLIIQIRIILKRKFSSAGRVGYATAVLSLNTFAASFCGFYAFFIYGISLTPWNNYLIWPRLVALLMVLWILMAIAWDRRSARAYFVSGVAVLLLAFGLIAMTGDLQLNAEKRLVSQWLTICVTIIIAQGYVHQIFLMYRNNSVGAVAKRLHQLTLLKDVFTVSFGLSMGLSDGWPLILLSGVSGMTKIILLGLYFSIERKNASQPIGSTLGS